jgi:Tfp pilus assembly protein PilE
MILQRNGATTMLIKSIIYCVLITCSFVSEAANQSSKQHVQASKTYDAKGKFIGKTTVNGRHYDAKGKYIGKTTVQVATTTPKADTHAKQSQVAVEQGCMAPKVNHCIH